MTDELFLYDQEKGLFRLVLEHSRVMEGRYFVLPKTTDIVNVEPPADVQKYPCVLCSPPRTLLVAPFNGGVQHFFSMYFLTRAGHTGQGDMKDENERGQSAHPAWYDWKDMAQCAQDFVYTLRDVLKQNRNNWGVGVSVDQNNVTIDRLTEVTVQNVTGVRISFSMSQTLDCPRSDYDGIPTITLPCEPIHPLHKH